VTEAHRDDAVVADELELEFQLFAPKPTVAYERALRRTSATLRIVERIIERIM